MAIHDIPTPPTPRKASTNLFSLPKSPDTNPLSLPKLSLTHTLSESSMHENIENAGIIVRKWDPSSPSLEKFTSLFQENRDEAREFAHRVEDLRQAMHFFVGQRSGHNHLVEANNLMKIAMLRLEKEFYYILSANRDCLNPDSVSSRSSNLSRSLSFSNSDDEVDDDRIVCDGEIHTTKVERAMFDLKLIAESMISSGYSKECGKIYRITRKSIVEEELYRLGIRSCNPSQITKMDHKILEQQVKNWVNAAKIAVGRIFRGERMLCDHVFAFSETIKQTCIAHTTMEAAMNLFKFPEIVAKGKRYPDKVFLLMNLFETVSGLWPEIESIFSYESLSPVKLQALSAIHKLSDAAQTILAEFVASIQKNSAKTPIPGGGIHPLTYTVMDYVCVLAENSGVLSDILDGDQENAAQSPFPESYFDGPGGGGPATKVAWIILVLLCKLDSKAELYKDIGLSYLFLANNLQYVVEKVSATALKLLLGVEWVSQLQKKVKLYAGKYESVAWAKVLASLPAEKETNPVAIKEHFRNFNAAFEAAYRKQRSWVVADPKLRDEIKTSVAGKLVPAYREFYDGGYVAILSVERNLEVLMRFSPDNLGNYLSDLFHGNDDEVPRNFSSPQLSSSASQSKLSRRCL